MRPKEATSRAENDRSTSQAEKPSAPRRYGLDRFIEQDCFAQLMDILRRIDGGNRLTDEDVVWLTTKAGRTTPTSFRSRTTRRRPSSMRALPADWRPVERGQCQQPLSQMRTGQRATGF